MNGHSAARHGRIGNGLQWAEEVSVDEVVGVRVVRSRRSFCLKDCWMMLRGRPLVVDAGLAGGDLMRGLSLLSVADND